MSQEDVDGDHDNPRGGFFATTQVSCPHKGPKYCFLPARPLPGYATGTCPSLHCQVHVVFPPWLLVLVLGKDDRWEGAGLG